MSKLSLEQEPPSSAMLNEVAKQLPVHEISMPETQSLIDAMFDFAYGEQGDAKRRTLVGLAAPQLGVSKRIIIIGMDAVGAGEQPKLQEFINPVLTGESSMQESGREGCFSTGNVCGIVERSAKVTIEGLNRNGQKIKRTLEGFPARVAQHEVDHLNGVRFPDRIRDDAKLHWVEKDEFGDYRRNWEHWPVLCPREKWEAIKSGSTENL